MAYRIEYITIPAASIQVAGKLFLPFSFEVPGHVQSILGLAVTSDAKVNLGAGINVSLASYNQFLRQIKFYNQTVQKFQPPTILSLNGHSVHLDTLALGSLTLRSYDAAQQFYSQTIYPERIESTLITNTNVVGKGSIDLSPFPRAGKRKMFIPIGIPVSTREISGFFEATSFGSQNILSGLTDVQKAQTLCLQPYQTTVHLKCLVKN